MDTLKTYKIPFSGLSEGIHQFEFRLDGKFFEEFGNEDLGNTEIDMYVDLDKQSSFLELNLQFEGSFKTECDRCSKELDLHLEGDRRLIAKVDGDKDDEDIICLGPQDNELDLAASFFETIAVALPLKRAHEEEDCDPEVIARLDHYAPKEPEETDPRWEALKKLKKD